MVPAKTRDNQALSHDLNSNRVSSLPLLTSILKFSESKRPSVQLRCNCLPQQPNIYRRPQSYLTQPILRLASSQIIKSSCIPRSRGTLLRLQLVLKSSDSTTTSRRVVYLNSESRWRIVAHSLTHSAWQSIPLTFIGTASRQRINLDQFKTIWTTRRTSTRPCVRF